MTQIEQGKHILKMIEGLAGYTEEEILREHVNTLDEIDARFWCFRRGYVFVKICDKQRTEGYYNRATLKTVFWKYHTIKTVYNEPLRVIPNPTRSRDVLKSARPDGWILTIFQHNYNAFNCELLSVGYKIKFYLLPTEELAELHALTQARIWELENGGRNE